MYIYIYLIPLGEDKVRVHYVCIYDESVERE